MTMDERETGKNPHKHNKNNERKVTTNKLAKGQLIKLSFVLGHKTKHMCPKEEAHLKEHRVPRV